MGTVAAAEEACRLEIDLLNEPIGKQDQYAAACGGLNIYQFNADGSVGVEPVLVDYLNRANFEDHIMLYFTGITRSASDVLGAQKTKMADHMETYKKMSDSVYDFRDLFLAGDYKGMAAMLHEGWLRKKSLSVGISNSLIDSMYEAGIEAGAWGGKILGAGGGGCLLFIAPPECHGTIREKLGNFFEANNLEEAKEISVRLTQSGANIIYNSNR
jgi:D-glycero-alpha-D-manno-heptose-7-phosphate kinase